MCSIISCCGPQPQPGYVKECFARSLSRGPDDTRFIDTGTGLMGFHRLAIMGLSPEGMQPFALDGSYAVCNGEIYGFEKFKEQLSEKYTFQSGSDCEVLLPLYKEHGTDMFKLLDAEFACVIFDGSTGEYIAARDPIGIRPLYYGAGDGGAMLFASEPKDLIGLCREIRPFPPGHYYKSGEFVCYRDISAAPQTCYDEIDAVCRNIHDKLIAGVKKRLVSDAEIGFLLSGGLDSSLVCAIAQRYSDTPIRTFAIGMSGDAIDLKYARQAADYIGSRHTEVVITKEDVLDALETVVAVLGTFDITTIRASIGMYLVCKYIHEHTDIRVLLTGEISDELFGYKYTDFAPSAQAFQAESQKRIRQLHMYDVLRADRCISVNSLEARVPFGDLDFVEYVMSIDPEKKLNRYHKGKYLLRKAFAEDGLLPEEILWREKAAFSDAVGHSMVDYLKEYANGLYTEAELENRTRAYAHARPFTKESLLYRELFEKYYPGQGQLVDGFWMPNPDWEGCRVDDPSARVLANYGASGE